MKTLSFKQIIETLKSRGVEITEVMKSNSYCGCINPGDIIQVEATANGVIFLYSVEKVFDEPIITADQVIRDNNGTCIYRKTKKQYKYVK